MSALTDRSSAVQLQPHELDIAAAPDSYRIVIHYGQGGRLNSDLPSDTARAELVGRVEERRTVDGFKGATIYAIKGDLGTLVGTFTKSKGWIWA